MIRTEKTILPMFPFGNFPIAAKSPLLAFMLGLTLLFWGCTQQRFTSLPSKPEKLGVGENLGKETLLKRLVQMEEKVKGIKAVQVVRVLNQPDGRTLHAQGLLALERPDKYRLRLFSSLGLTLFEFVLSREEFRFRMPSKGIDISGKKEEAAEKIPYFPVEALKEAFVHSYEADRIELHQLESAHLLILHRKGKITLIRRWINRQDLTLLKEIFLRNEREELVIDYGDYRPHGEGNGFLLPYRIDIRLPHEGIRLEIKAVKYEINPTFNKKMFDLY